MKTGIYVGLNVSPPSNQLLLDYCVANDIQVNVDTFKEKIHTTVIYSRKHDIIETDRERVYLATVSGFDLFSDRSGKNAVLVAKLNAPDLVQRHVYLMNRHDLTYDYAEYVPHVTLCYDFSGDISTLPPIKFPILLTGEYSELLKFDSVI